MNRKMKRFSCFLLCFLMMAALGLPSAAAVSLSMDEAEVKSIAENYISERTRKVYLYESAYQGVAAQTLLDVLPEPAATRANIESEAESALSVTAQQALVSFVEENEPELMASMEREDISLSTMQNDLQSMDDMTAYKSYVYEDQGFEYDYFDAQYLFSDVTVSGDYATVVMYEELNYQYDDCDDPSYELGEYNLILSKIDGEWVVVDVVTDDVAFLGYASEGYDLDAEISAYNSAMLSAENELPQIVNAPVADVDTGTQRSASNDISYNQQTAANYALTYTTSDDDGSSTPSFRNTRFHWFGADCMNFCSQAVWAGFGGSNSWSDIPAKNGMDTLGTATWWCTDTTGTNSWASCSSFRTYVNSVASDTTGLVCDSESITGSTNTLPFTASQLVGAVLHVEGTVSGVPTAKAHAVFVNAATGNTRDTVMVCAYNRCRKNVKLSSVCAVGGSTKAVQVIVPQTFKGGKPSLFICGSWINVINTQSASRTLSGYSNVTLSSFQMTLLKPDGSTAGTWSSTNSTSVTGTYNNWNASGEWILKLTGTTSAGASKTWYGAVRVVLK